MSNLDNHTAVNEDNDETFDQLGNIDFQRFLLIFQKNILWILLILIISAVSCFTYLRYAIPIYESSSVLKLEIKSDVDALGIPGIQKPKISNNLSGEIELIKSELIYDQVIAIIPQLQISYYSIGRIKDEERFLNSFFKLEYKQIHPQLFDQKIQLEIISKGSFKLSYSIDGNDFSQQFNFDELSRNEHMEIKMSKNFDPDEAIEHNNFFVLINSRNALINMLQNNLEVQIVNPNANTLKIIYKDPNPVKAQKIVECINNVYLTNTLEIKNQASKQTIDFLDEQLQKTEKKLAEAEKEIELFINENKTINISNLYDLNVNKIEALHLKIQANREKLRILTNLDEIYRSSDTSSYQVLISSNNELISQFKTQIDLILERKQKLKSLQHSTNANTLAYQLIVEEVQYLEKNLKSSIEQVKGQLLKEYTILSSKLAEIEYAIIDLPSRETEYNRLKRNYQLSEKFYLLLMDKKAEFGISEAGVIPDFQVLSPASQPHEAISPKPIETYAIGFGVSIVLSFLLLTFRFISHDTIDTVDEIEKQLNIPILGSVPFHVFKGKLTKQVVTDNPKSEIAEAIRTIRTNLDFMIPNNGGKKLLSVTSTVGSEGKTFISVNLAAIISMSNKKVIVIDLDMRKPKLHLALDLENNFGMSNLLIGQMKLSEVIRPSLHENLDFISSGPPPPNPSELILLPELDNLIEELKGLYDVIIIDTPPIGLVTDGMIIMKKVDLSLYIVRSEYSKRMFLRNINKLHIQNKIKHLSIIFNGVKKHGGVGYGYGSTYGYSDPSGYYEDTKKKSVFKIFS